VHPVVLMHNQPAGNPATVRALPAIIRYFRSQGYTIVDLLGRTGWSSGQASQTATQANRTVDVLAKATGTDLTHHWHTRGPG
jgi:hypothetical protein